MNIYEKLINIQRKLNAPKNQFNKFGNYSYRNCEDVLEALKPLLAENKTTLTITDNIIQVGDRFYVEATAVLHDCEKVEDKIYVKAYARESLEKKGMDSSQVTGATSSYARKYALNGLFAIDDNKDSDSMKPEEPEKNKETAKKEELKITKNEVQIIEDLLKNAPERREKLLQYYKITKLEELPREKYVDVLSKLQK